MSTTKTSRKNSNQFLREYSKIKSSFSHYQQKHYQIQFKFSHNQNLNNPQLSISNKIRTSTTQSQNQINKNKFKVIRQLGFGKYGTVDLVMDINTRYIAALKSIKKSIIAKSQRLKKQLIMEIKIHSYLYHQNIIELYSFFDDQKYIYLLMELGCDGSLYSLMQQKQLQFKYFSQQSVSLLIKQVLQGLNKIHSQGIIHRDLKPENIVMIHGVPKICDFGCSAYCSTSLRKTVCGTPLYFSPQMLLGNQYDEKIDIWSIGALTHQLYTGLCLFNITSKQQLKRIITNQFEMKIGSNYIKAFVRRCLRKNPVYRPKAQLLLNHSFIRKYSYLQTSQELCRQ